MIPSTNYLTDQMLMKTSTLLHYIVQLYMALWNLRKLAIFIDESWVERYSKLKKIISKTDLTKNISCTIEAAQVAQVAQRRIRHCCSTNFFNKARFKSSVEVQSLILMMSSIEGTSGNGLDISSGLIHLCRSNES